MVDAEAVPVTVRMPVDRRDALDDLARALDRDRSYLVNEAVAQSGPSGRNGGAARQGPGANTDLRWIAYILGTTFHETARTMRPIEEYGRGAGRIPTAWSIPRRAKPITAAASSNSHGSRTTLPWASDCGIDLVRNPELALDLTTATDIIYDGMSGGSFTGGRFSLSVFFNSERSDWYNARRIVNGLDRAQDIANYSLAFYKAAIAASGRRPHMASLRATQPGPSLADSEPDYVELEKDALMADLQS